jgi:hypothetical protein
MSSDAALPNYRRPEVEAAKDDLTLVADLLAGTRRMHERATEYIRKWDAEQPAVYKIRRECETTFEGLGRTLSAATGMLFAKAPSVEWNESETAIAPHWDNLDAAGTKGTVLVKRFSEAAIRDGLGGILVDHPSAPEGTVVTAANEQALGLRPTWALYDRAQVINWRTAVINNRRTLTLVVLHECAEVEDGAFGIASVHRYRVLRLVLTPTGYQATWTLYEQTEEQVRSLADSFTIKGSGVFKNRSGAVADFLPFSVAYTGRTVAPMTATIPLLGVAWANLAHWQASTDLRFYRMLCAFPQPTVTGTLAPDPVTGNPTSLKVGPMVAVHLSEADAKFQWTELTGSSMDQLEKGIDEKLRQMSKLGMAFLQTDTRAAETAEAKRLDATAENSTLATAAQGIEDAVNAALEFHAWYLGIEKKSAPVLTINRDFESTVMDAPTMLAYVAAFRDAGLPIRILLEAWQAGGRIAQDADLDELEGEMEAQAAAKEEADRQRMKDELAMKQQQPLPKAA